MLLFFTPHMSALLFHPSSEIPKYLFTYLWILWLRRRTYLPTAGLMNTSLKRWAIFQPVYEWHMINTLSLPRHHWLFPHYTMKLLHSSLKARDQVSQPYTSTCNIIDSYILMFKLLKFNMTMFGLKAALISCCKFIFCFFMDENIIWVNPVLLKERLNI